MNLKALEKVSRIGCKYEPSISLYLYWASPFEGLAKGQLHGMDKGLCVSVSPFFSLQPVLQCYCRLIQKQRMISNQVFFLFYFKNMPEKQ